MRPSETLNTFFLNMTLSYKKHNNNTSFSIYNSRKCSLPITLLDWSLYLWYVSSRHPQTQHIGKRETLTTHFFSLSFEKLFPPRSFLSTHTVEKFALLVLPAREKMKKHRRRNSEGTAVSLDDASRTAFILGAALGFSPTQSAWFVHSNHVHEKAECFLPDGTLPALKPSLRTQTWTTALCVTPYVCVCALPALYGSLQWSSIFWLLCVCALCMCVFVLSVQSLHARETV